MNYKLNLYTPVEISRNIAVNAKRLRLQLNLKQITLSEKSGVSVSSIKRFESTGCVSLSSLLKIANVLDCLQEFSFLFPSKLSKSVSDLEKSEKNKFRCRGTL